MEAKDQKQQVPDKFYYLLAFKAAADLGVSIAVPAVAGAYLGKYLDDIWGTKPIMFAIMLIVAFLLTSIYVIRKVYYYADLYKNGPKSK
ncbi:AtpZ/AtpI family protein [Patescibacteria group bacterium]|nr:AtpZ/AtpI family protein [Patescibacteria group bacterium]